MKQIIPFTFFFTLLAHLNSQTTVFDTITSGGLQRDFRMYIPASYDGGEAVPLLLSLHGYGTDNFGQALYANFNLVADTAGFITVIPNGTFDDSGQRFWNCWVEPGIGVNDVQFISDLIDSVSAVYNIDPNRIYSTGMSNGGFMSHTLACELSDKIAAIASVAGTMSKSRLFYCDAGHTVPVLQIHGTEDTIVPYNGTVDWVSVDSIINYWVDHNHCSATPDFIEVPDLTTADSSTAEHYIYGGCWKGVTTELFRIEGGEHTWPGSPIIFIGVTNQDINACVEIWKFVSRYRLDELTPLSESNHVDEIFIKPNPFSGLCTIWITSEIKIKTVNVYDYTGRNIFSISDVKSTSLNIDTHQWTKGIYIISLLSDIGIINQKVVKM